MTPIGQRGCKEHGDSIEAVSLVRHFTATRELSQLEWVTTRAHKGYVITYPLWNEFRWLSCPSDGTASEANRLLIANDDTPLVLLVAVHDVAHHFLDLGSVDTHLAHLTLAQGNMNVGTAMVDLGNGGNEELQAKER